MRGPIPDKPQNRPTVPEVCKLATAYRSQPGNSMGGSLHIVLADGNLQDGHVAFCRDYAAERGDKDGVALADAFLALTRTQRRKVYQEHG